MRGDGVAVISDHRRFTFSTCLDHRYLCDMRLRPSLASRTKTRSRRADPLLMDDSDESEDEDWDFAALRRAAEDEREAAERARIEALGGSVGSMSIQS